MSNSIKGEVPLRLADGREFTLVFDMEALIEAEGAYGKPLQVVLSDAEEGFMGDIRAMLYGALRSRHPDVQLKDVSSLLADNTEAITKALTEAHKASQPSTTGASAEGNVSPQVGKNSGVSGAKRGSTRKASGA